MNDHEPTGSPGPAVETEPEPPVTEAPAPSSMVDGEEHHVDPRSVAVATTGAGGTGHRIRIPFLDVDIAESILQRLSAETRSTEFRW